MQNHRLVGLTCLALALAACGGTSGPTTLTSAARPATSSSTPSPESSTSTLPAVTSTAPQTTSTSPPTTSTNSTTSTTSTTTSLPAPAPTVPQPGPDGAAGAGCTPGTEALGDGVWFGLVAGAGQEQLQFDLACWFTGDAAAAAAAADGQESPPPNDYYVRNANPAIRTLTVDPAAQALWYPDGDPNSFSTGGYTDWLAARDGTFPFGVWVRMQSGRVVTVTEQWVP